MVSLFRGALRHFHDKGALNMANMVVLFQVCYIGVGILTGIAEEMKLNCAVVGMCGFL